MRKKLRSYTLCSSSLTPDCEPLPYISPYTLHRQGGGHSLWGMTLLCSLLCWLENKNHLHISFNLLSLYFLFGFTGQRKPEFWPATILVLGHCQSSCPEDKVHGSLWIPIFSGSEPRHGIVRPCGFWMFSWKRTSLLVLIVPAPIYAPTDRVGEFPFASILCSPYSL